MRISGILIIGLGALMQSCFFQHDLSAPKNTHGVESAIDTSVFSFITDKSLQQVLNDCIVDDLGDEDRLYVTVFFDCNSSSLRMIYSSDVFACTERRFVWSHALPSHIIDETHIGAIGSGHMSAIVWYYSSSCIDSSKLDNQLAFAWMGENYFKFLANNRYVKYYQVNIDPDHKGGWVVDKSKSLSLMDEEEFVISGLFFPYYALFEERKTPL